jgi:hypothetical protein
MDDPRKNDEETLVGHRPFNQPQCHECNFLEPRVRHQTSRQTQTSFSRFQIRHQFPTKPGKLLQNEVQNRKTTRKRNHKIEQKRIYE